MADDTPTTAMVQPPRTIREAIVNAPAKIVLAFFLTVVAANMVIVLLIILVYAKGTIDAGTIALIASMVMLFIKMAADGNGYQFNSSAGSDKKDDVNATVSKALADKVQPAAPVVPPPAPIAWWGRLKNGEPAAITAAAATDPKVMAFITAANVGAATPDDLTYLVTKGLLTQERATAIQAA